jgi:cytochrome P450
MGLLIDALTLEVPRRPFLMRTGLGILRRNRPVLSMGGAVVVTSEALVREVFSRPKDFLFGFGNGPKMKLGPFLFGMDASDQYFAEKEALHKVATKDQSVIDRFGTLVKKHADACLGRLEPGPSVDLLSSFIEPVLLGASAEFYGVDPEQAEPSRYVDAAPGFKTYAQWVRKLGGTVGSVWPAPFGLEDLSDRLAEEMRVFLEKQVDASRSRGAGTASVIDGLIGLNPSPLKTSFDIARCIGGLMLAGAAMIKATTLALHELLQREAVAAEVANAARNGDLKRVRGYVWEALRFNPPFPILTRYSPRATVLAAGTPNETPVAENTTLFISPLAAMFDPANVDRPEQFISTRPANTYYIFGFGLHRCFGEQLAVVGLQRIFTSLLAAFKLEKGRIAYDGPAIARYTATIDQRIFPEGVNNASERTNYPRPRTPHSRAA